MSFPVATSSHRYPIRRAILGGLGGIASTGMLLLILAIAYLIASTEVHNAAVLRGYSLLDTIGQLQVAEEATRSAVLVAIQEPTQANLDAMGARYGEVRITMRALVRQGAGDPALSGAQESAAGPVSHWYDTWVSPIHDTLARGDNVAPYRELALVVGDQTFSQMRTDTEALRATSTTRINATLDSFAAQTRLLLGGVALAAILLCLGVLWIGRWLIRTVTGPLKRLNEAAFAQLNGEQVEFRAEHDDEVGGLAVVLERLRLMVEDRYAGARQEARRAETMNKLGDLMTFSTAEVEVIDGTVRALCRLIDTRRGDVQLTNASRNRLLYAGSWGPNPPGLDTPVAIDRIDRCPAIRRAAPFVVPDVEDDLAVLCAAHQQEGGSLACVPLIAMGQPIGVIHLESDTPISDDMVAVAMRLAEQVAVAIANSRLMTTMEGLAMTDGLTGMRNARFFDSYLDQELSSAERDHEPLSLLMLDIDHFKQFNDSHGHPAGDEALRVFGQVLRASLRSSDVAARYGGEEFIVALRHTDLDGAARVAENLRQAVSQAIVEIGPGRFGRLSVSIGVAEADLARIDQKRLIGSADAALYRAKSGGRNRVELATRSGEAQSDITNTDRLTTRTAPTRADEPVALSPRRRRRPPVQPSGVLPPEPRALRG